MIHPKVGRSALDLADASFTRGVTPLRLAPCCLVRCAVIYTCEKLCETLPCPSGSPECCTPNGSEQQRVKANGSLAVASNLEAELGPKRTFLVWLSCC